MSDYAQVVVLASQKGGSGKTTLAGHIAVQAELSGAGPVALIDTDPQGSLAKWWNARASAAPAFAQVSVPDLGRDIEALRDGGFRLIVIDTPPAVTSLIAEVITHADLVIVPTRPSPHDLRAVGATLDIVEHQRKPVVFVINGATMRARITGEMAVALSQHGTVAPVTAHHRVDFAASMIDGRTVGEVDANSRSAKEIADLWIYVADRLMRLRAGAEATLGLTRPSFESELLTPAKATKAPPEPNSKDVPEPPMPGAAAVAPARIASAEIAPQPAMDFTQNGFGPGTAVENAATSDEWDGVDRRKVDNGPSPGFKERRRLHVTFGRRGLEHDQRSGKA